MSSPDAPSPDAPAAPSPLRVGVLGAGLISTSVHLPLLARHPEVRVVAVADLDPVRAADAAARYGAAAVTPDALLTEVGLDAVVVATPGNHAALAERALRAGRHVLAEKPFALTQEAARAAASVADETGLVLQVGYMKAHDPALDVLAAWRGRIGELRRVEVDVRHPADGPQLGHVRPLAAGGLDEAGRVAADELDGADWAAVRQAVGDVPVEWERLYRYVLHGSVVHEVSLLRSVGLLPESEPDFAVVAAWDGGAPPSLTVSAPLPDEARLLLTWAWLADHPRYEEVLRLVGTAGSLEVRLAPPYRLDTPSRVRLVAAGEGGGPAVEQEAVLPATGGFQAQVEAFVDAVRGRAPVRTTAADAALDTAWLQGLFRRLAAGRGVAVGGESADA